MRRAGRPLDAWQQDSISLMLATRADGKWTCFEFAEWCARQNGKGAVLEARSLTGLFLLGEELIMWSAHEYKTAMEAFRRLLVLLRRLGRKVNDTLYEIDGILLKVHNTNGEEGVERLDTGQRIKFVARSKSSGRGFSGDVVIVDESFAYSQVQQDALLPTLSARPNPQIIYTSSPPLTTDSGEVMFLLRQRGDPTAPRSPDAPGWEQDDSLGYRDWGLAGDLDNLADLDPTDPALWADTNPGLGIRITAETVARELRSMGPIGFARERLGVWPRSPLGQAGWLVIPEPAWADAADPNSKHRPPVAICIEAALDRSQATVAVAARRRAGGRHVELAALRGGTGWVVPYVRDLIARRRPCAVVVDTAGPAGSLVADLETAGIDLIKPSVRELAAACGAFYDGIACKVEPGADPRVVRDIHHIEQGPLTAAVAGLTKRRVAETQVYERAGQGFLAVAAALALHGLAVNGHLDYDPLNSVRIAGGED